MPLTTQPAETRTLLKNVSWAEFESMTADDGPVRGRLAYEEGTVEIMSPSIRHEDLKSVLGRLIEAYAQEMGIDMMVTGSTTLKRELNKRGAEPDESYYVQNEKLIRGLHELDLDRDPPPDLAIEIQITTSALNKLGIYGAMGVPEVWLWEGDHLQVYWLNPTGKYDARDRSRALPDLPLAELLRFVAQSGAKSTTRLINEFREWLRGSLRQDG